jgi:hypothetical protein
MPVLLHVCAAVEAPEEEPGLVKTVAPLTPPWLHGTLEKELSQAGICAKEFTGKTIIKIKEIMRANFNKFFVLIFIIRD